MKISKLKFVIIVCIFLLAVIIVGRTAYNRGQLYASPTIVEATPLELAQVMQSDNFWGKYTQTILLIKGRVQEIKKQGNNTIVQFYTTNTPSVLGKVSCDINNNHNQIKQGDTIRVLTVAHDALRIKPTSVFMPNCYFLE